MGSIVWFWRDLKTSIWCLQVPHSLYLIKATRSMSSLIQYIYILYRLSLWNRSLIFFCFFKRTKNGNIKMRDQIEKTLWKIIEYNASKIKWWIFKAINENSVTLSGGLQRSAATYSRHSSISTWVCKLYFLPPLLREYNGIAGKSFLTVLCILARLER